MATLPKEPAGLELEDFVAAHFACRGCYVESHIKEFRPDEILELDVVWTDYRKDPEVRRPVEVKSGRWGMSDIFKFFGWTCYLGLEPGQFIHTESCGRVEPSTLQHVEQQTKIAFMHVSKPEDVESHLKAVGLPEPPLDVLPDLWRYSFAARRRLVKALGIAIEANVCPASAKAAKDYLRLVNDAVFFIPDVRDRIAKLLEAHFGHQHLGRSAAYEMETGKAEFDNPPDTQTFKRAYFYGKHFPVQACLYVEHRARLYIMKALVDYWLALKRGEIKERMSALNIGGKKFFVTQSQRLTDAMEKGMQKLSEAKSFRLFPVFWQVFLWSWGGFLLQDRRATEFSELEKETGVPVEEIPIALTAFDEIFPTDKGWFRNPSGGDLREVLILTPAAMRGLGAFRRMLRSPEKKSYVNVDMSTSGRMASDQDSAVRLLDCKETELAK